MLKAVKRRIAFCPNVIWSTSFGAIFASTTRSSERGTISIICLPGPTRLLSCVRTTAEPPRPRRTHIDARQLVLRPGRMFRFGLSGRAGAATVADAAGGRAFDTQAHAQSLRRSVCDRWVESLYLQYFCGEAVFQHAAPFDRSSRRAGPSDWERSRLRRCFRRAPQWRTAELAEFVHKVAYAGTGGADYLRQYFLADMNLDRLQAAVLPKVRQ